MVLLPQQAKPWLIWQNLNWQFLHLKRRQRGHLCESTEVYVDQPNEVTTLVEPCIPDSTHLQLLTGD